jgi:hypothetical protein
MNIFESVARQRPVSLSVPGSTSTVLRVRKGARQKFLAGNESRGNRSGSSFVLLAWKWQREFIVIQGYTRSIQPKFPGNIREVTPRTETRKSEQLVFGTSNSGSASRDQSIRIRCFSSDFLRTYGWWSRRIPSLEEVSRPSSGFLASYPRGSPWRSLLHPFFFRKLRRVASQWSGSAS